jgi:formylglycine-generating enzyme
MDMQRETRHGSEDGCEFQAEVSDQEQSALACCPPAASRGAAPLPAPNFVSAATKACGIQKNASNGSMVLLPGGPFLMGTDYAGGFQEDGEGPVRSVELSPFAIDRYPVTNREFAAFVEASGYRTDAERFGWSFVFWRHIASDRYDQLVEDTVAQAPWWCKVPGSFWKQPEGPGSSIEKRWTHPVVHVSWNDAAAYSRWALKSLPTEAQWECAAKGGLEQKLFPWGDELTPGGQHRCNVWQGNFPFEDTAEDGYAGTCPVDAFPPNEYGIYSVIGNVWEWCADWFSIPGPFELELRDPEGPPAGSNKVMKGGSFLCHASYCNRYRVAARTSNTPDSSASNIGFRCVSQHREGRDEHSRLGPP